MNNDNNENSNLDKKYTGTVVLNVHCTVMSGWLHSTSFYIPFKSSECTIKLNGINIPNLGSVVLDYKTISNIGDYNYELKSTVANASGNSTLHGNIATINLTITKK